MEALGELVKDAGVPANRPLTIADIEKLETEVAKLSAADMRALAKDLREGKKSGKKAPLVDMLQEAKGRAAQPGYESVEDRVKREKAEEAAQAEAEAEAERQKRARDAAAAQDQKPVTPAKPVERGPTADQPKPGTPTEPKETSKDGGIPTYDGSSLDTKESFEAATTSSTQLIYALDYTSKGTDDASTPQKEVLLTIGFSEDGKQVAAAFPIRATLLRIDKGKGWTDTWFRIEQRIKWPLGDQGGVNSGVELNLVVRDKPAPAKKATPPRPKK
jgi:hypothetical protein